MIITNNDENWMQYIAYGLQRQICAFLVTRIFSLEPLDCTKYVFYVPIYS